MITICVGHCIYALGTHLLTSIPSFLYWSRLGSCYNVCRVLALKALCEARLDREDLRGRVEDAIRPSKETRMAAKATGVLPGVDDFRRGPTGTDSSGLEYHYFELRLCTEGAGCSSVDLLTV